MLRHSAYCLPSRLLLVPTTICLAGAAVLNATEAASSRDTHRIAALRIDEAPTIDGRLDEAVWQDAPVVEQFTQQEPLEGEAATERTEVRMLYDSSNLYIGVRAFDSDPEGIIATEMRRDSQQMLNEDNFQFIIDTFNDSRSGYMFATNPLGAKLEQQIFEEGEGSGFFGPNSNINIDWDGVWNVRSRRTEAGWVAEIAIPMRTLRFIPGESQSWGINFMRLIRRKNESVFWAPIPKAYSLTRVSLAGSLDGLEALSQGVDLRIKPFVVAGGEGERVDGEIEGSGLGEVGLDMTYGVTSGLNLDVTVNTDFAQVEVDEQQVNLTRFSLFFPEKRDFFLENAGLSTVGALTPRLKTADLFFSRRVGLSDRGQPVPIIAGGRLTGKSGRNNIAVMDIQTDDAFGESGENFLVSRYGRDVFAKSKVGGMFINKQSADGSSFNRTMAVDTALSFGNLSVNSFMAKTSSPDITTGDMAYYGRVGWLSPIWNLWAEYSDIQDNFNAEVGFVPRTGIRSTQFMFAPTPRPKRFNIRTLLPMYNLLYTTDQNNRLVTRRAHWMVGFQMEDGSFINLIYNDRLEGLDLPFQIAPGVIIPPGSYNFGEPQFMFNSNPARRFYYQLRYVPQTFFDGTRTDYNVTLGLRPSSRFAVEARYVRNDVELPYGAFEVNLGILRVDYALSPSTTIRSLIQYNSSTNRLSTSVRFNMRYTPGSDFYITYDEARDTFGRDIFLRNRQLVVKLDYLIAR
ncbi:MAG: hypothetical protein CL471_08970 [Acidobacteria bacterium]|nr:hypothetical protein [Acidobacteriota bacterium]